ncbi:translation initiation factor IF-3 [Candidatus Blochmanniella pennsylvanica str. BPEN]|uniref:Translation initiation factor IF-3 n=2 Tax=Candidatus Blochmanniella TaxID=203804 RepID=Q492V4_BLOPB|nr:MULTISPECIES: translation initiation factor IF-3 [Blochmannia]AAZ40988.1 translation initiation factor IF-3 [Candidatus Blochmannia pennsylvanicus str. BPEN]AGC03631.1 Translation initiation factor IF-3 [Candidatus Blochmannia chromaiodes str. 640]UOY04673.1 translation initiation factor IF-3 [Candidatus Blochmannia pennsylvanicus]
MKFAKKIQSIRLNRINREISAVKVRLTGVDGKQIGVVSLHEALKQSEDIGLDLVEVSPNSDPPVCRIMNYGKFLYEKNKSTKEQKKKQKVIHVKEIKFRPSTDEGDYQVKLRNLIKFLNEGDKVKITLRFRGGELVHHQLGAKILYRIRHELHELTTVEFFSNKIEGRQMTMILAPKKK